MNPLLLIICLVLAALQMSMPRRWAFLPLLIAACHTPYTPFLGGLTAARVVILIGLLRAGGQGWMRWSSRNPLDILVAVFACVALVSVVGHAWHPSNPLVARLRLALDVGGTYLYMRAYLTDREALQNLGSGLALILIPFAVLLLAEKHAGFKPYALVGIDNVESQVRDGKIRAQGPFGTPILAGTVGASSIPLLIPLLGTRRLLAMGGLVAGVVVVYTSGSSGPISTIALGVAAVAFWRWRQFLRPTSIAICICLLAVHLIKNRPVWYLMALMDLVGGSTGWHRAYLIDMAVKHLNEWWLFGSDFTAHWMPYSLGAFPEHCDLTNYYIQLGVIGGLPLTLCLIVMQWKAFRILGERMALIRGSDIAGEFSLWCLGSALFAHAVTFLSISYFDQIYVFFWGLLGGLTSLVASDASEEVTDESVVEGLEEETETNDLRCSMGRPSNRPDLNGY